VMNAKSLNCEATPIVFWVSIALPEILLKIYKSYFPIFVFIFYPCDFWSPAL